MVSNIHNSTPSKKCDDRDEHGAECTQVAVLALESEAPSFFHESVPAPDAKAADAEDTGSGSLPLFSDPWLAWIETTADASAPSGMERRAFEPESEICFHEGGDLAALLGFPILKLDPVDAVALFQSRRCELPCVEMFS